MKIKKPPVVVRVLLGIVSVLLCVALFVGIFAAMVVGNIRVMTSKDNLQTFISELLFAMPKKSAPVIWRQGVGVGGVRLDEAEAGLPESQQMVVDFFYDMLQEQLGEDMPIEKENVEALLSESTVPEFLSEKMASIMSDVLNGEATTTITADEIVELVEENKTLIEDVIGMEITQEHLDAVTQWVEEADITTTVQEVVKGNLGLKGPEDAQPEAGGIVLRTAVCIGLWHGAYGLGPLCTAGYCPDLPGIPAVWPDVPQMGRKNRHIAARQYGHQAAVRSVAVCAAGRC